MCPKLISIKKFVRFSMLHLIKKKNRKNSDLKMVENEVNETKYNRSKKYLTYLGFILVLVLILDTYASNMMGVVNSLIGADFLPSISDVERASVLSLVSAFAQIGLFLSLLNQWLADKFGRKVLLLITVIGMGLASFLLIFATNIVMYAIFFFFLNIFFYADIHGLYRAEEAPKDKRLLFIALIGIFALFGNLLLPLMRGIFITETSPPSAWRGMTYLTIILSLILTPLIIFTVKETSVYQRLKDSNTREEEKKLSKSRIKLLFAPERKKEVLTLLAMTFIRAFLLAFYTLAEPFLASSPFLTQDDINIVIAFMSIGLLVGGLINMFVGDRYGRKPLLYLYSI